MRIWGMELLDGKEHIGGAQVRDKGAGRGKMEGHIPPELVGEGMQRCQHHVP